MTDEIKVLENKLGVGEKDARAYPALDIVIIAGFFSVVAWILYNPDLLSGPGAGVAGVVIGHVASKAEAVISYRYGSSAGSARKTELLKRD